MDSDLPPSGFSTSPSASSTISCTNAMPCKDASGRTTAKTQKTNGYPLKKTLKNNPCLCLQLDSMTLYDSMIDPFLRPRTSGDGSKARLFHWSKMDPRRMSCHQISKKNKSVIVFFCFFFVFGIPFVHFIPKPRKRLNHQTFQAIRALRSISCKCKTWNFFEAKQLRSKAHAKKRFVIFGQFHLSLMSHLCSLLNQLNPLFFWSEKSEKSCEICTFT